MRSRWLGCLLVLAACGDSADDPNGGTGSLGPGPFADSGSPIVTPGGTVSGTTIPGAVAGTVSGGIAGTTMPGGTTAGTTAGGTTAGATAGGTTSGGTATGEVPCEVQKLLKDKCNTCHSNPPTGSAPMPLVTLADFNASSKIMTTQKISARVKARISDTKMPMPPAGRTPLTAAEKTALTAFIDGGLKPATAACTTQPSTGGTTSGGTGGTGVGGTWQPPDSDCDVLLELRAHGGSTEGDTSPYMAPSGGDHYEIFWYRPTWTEKMQVIRIDPIIDNAAVLHHWLLYQKPGGSEAAGSHNSDVGLQSSDSSLLSGWAPGNDSVPLGKEIGLRTIQGSQARYGIEIHYNTGANPPNRADRSGARICVTKKMRTHEAAVHWLGTQAIFSDQAVGTCTVPKESHIIAHSPHMHKLGKYMKTIVTKQAGGSVTITDKPFAFDDQQIFPVDAPGGEIVVQPGDVITTTCDYTGFATFGTGTADEMCYNFVIAYPVGSLQSLSLLTVGGAETTCIDGL